MNPEKLQTMMDQGAKDLRRMIGETLAAADALCASGDFDESAAAWELLSALAHAHALGRALNIGGVQPRSGKD